MDYVTEYQFTSEISEVYKKRLFEVLKDKSVLDLGCGKGDYLENFGPKSMGLDLSPQNIKFSKTRKHPIKEADLNNPPILKQKFDAVFMSHVLEHVESPINLLRYANRSLKANGLIIVAVPNEHAYIHLYYPYYTNNGNHLYNFTIANMKELLLTAGFDKPIVYYDYYTNLTKKLKINGLLKYVNFAPSFVKSKFAWAHWFVARKNKEV